MRLSISDVRNSWIVPNTGYNANSIHFSGESTINKYIQIGGRATYYRKASDNLPVSGYTAQSPLKVLIFGPTTVSVDDWYEEYINNRTEYVYENDMNTLTNLINRMSNIYRLVNTNLNTLDNNRFYGNINTTIHVVPQKISLLLRGGVDYSSSSRTQQKPYYTTNYAQGFYREQTILQYEHNLDFLATYKERLPSAQLDFNVVLGGNSMLRKYDSSTSTAKQLYAPNLYQLNNVDGALIHSLSRSTKAINSLFGTASVGWKGMAYMEVTGRNDWSSTLPKANNSYFYPSVNLSLLLHEMFNIEKIAPWNDYLKTRFSFAKVGNDTSPHQLSQVYGNTNFTSGYVISNTRQNDNLKPESVESWEVGLETKLLKNRIGIDVALYSTATTDQIISLPSDPSSGVSSRMINAGKVTNKGIEISSYFQILKGKTWSWRMGLNWAKNKNKLVSLAPGVDLWQLNGNNTIGNRIFLYAYPGQELGRLYGAGHLKAPKGSFYVDENGEKIDCSGQTVIDPSTGNPILSTELKDLGSIHADWNAGMTQALRFKNWRLSASFDWKKGGKAYSVTDAGLFNTGKLKSTLPGRYDGLLVPGVNVDSKGMYHKNETTTTNIVLYYQNSEGSLDNVERSVHSTSYLKMKECRLEYAFPKKVYSKIGCQSLSLAVWATNLFCISDWPQYDPQVASFGGGSLYRGVETGGFPMTRSYGLNLNVSF